MINFNESDSKHLNLEQVDAAVIDQANSPNSSSSLSDSEHVDFGSLDYSALNFDKMEFEKIDFGGMNIEPLKVEDLPPGSFGTGCMATHPMATGPVAIRTEPTGTEALESTASEYAGFEDADAKVELLKVHAILSHMSERLEKVEQCCQPLALTSVIQEAPQLRSEIHTAPYSISRQRQALRAVEAVPNMEISAYQQESANGRESNPAVESREPNQPSRSFEMRVGKYWLNRIGIGSLVLGLVFLLLYSYQFFGVIGKLLIGFLASAILVIGGDRIARHKGEEWYGNALIGGGWALMYFTAYAMHFVPQLRIIDSFAVELIPLFAVAGGAMWHAVKSKSEIIGLIATLFGILAIGFGPASTLSYVGYFGIAAAASIVAISMRWTKQMYLTIISCYGAFACTTGRLTFFGFGSWSEWSLSDPWYSIGALVSYWSVFNAAMVTFAKGQTKSNQSVIGFTWLNFLFFTTGTFLVASFQLHDWLYWIFGGAATLYIMTEPTLEQRKLPFLSTLHIFFGLTLLNIAFCLKFHGVDLQNIIFIEVPILCAIYLQTNKWVYANFASTVAVLCLLDWTGANLWIDTSYSILGIKSLPHLLSGIVAAAAFAATHMMFEHEADATAQHGVSSESESDAHLVPKRNFSKLYYVLTHVAVAALPFSFVHNDACTLYWSVQACVATVFSIWKRSAVYSTCSTTLVILATIALAFSSVSEIKPFVCSAVVLYYFVDWCLSHHGYAERAALPLGNRTYAHLANLVVCMLMFQLQHEYITLGLGIAGMTMLIVGFCAKLQVYRGWGLVMLGFLTGKLLLVDLAKADTMERIIAFIAAGGICLGCSYAYSKFAEKTETQPMRVEEQVA
jgi:hypothetical protein